MHLVGRYLGAPSGMVGPYWTPEPSKVLEPSSLRDIPIPNIPVGWCLDGLDRLWIALLDGVTCSSNILVGRWLEIETLLGSMVWNLVERPMGRWAHTRPPESFQAHFSVDIPMPQWANGYVSCHVSATSSNTRGRGPRQL